MGDKLNSLSQEEQRLARSVAGYIELARELLTPLYP